MLPVIKPIVEGAVKYTVLCLCTYYVFLQTLPHSPEKSRRLIGMLPLVLLGVSMQFLKPLIGTWNVIFMVTVLTLYYSLFFRSRLKRTVSLSITGFCLCYGVFLLVGLVTSFAAYWYNEIVIPSEMWRADMKTKNWVNVALFLFMESLMAVVIYLLLQNKRIQRGLLLIGDFGEKDAGIYLSLMLILTASAFIYYSQQDVDSIFSTVSVLLTFFFFFSLVFWIRHEVHVVYHNRQREANFAKMENDLRIAEQEIAVLRQDNERLSAVIHRDNKLIPAMVTSARQYVSSAGLSEIGIGSDPSVAELATTVRQLEAIYTERMSAIVQYEHHDNPLPKTGLATLDAILSYMQRRASAQSTRFTLTTLPELSTALTQASIDRRHFATMMADLTENALIAVQCDGVGIKAVDVTIGRDKHGHLFLAVSDSGAPFAPEVLRQMGKKKITTHGQEGGSGIGLMTLFSLLKEYRASFRLESFTGRADSSFVGGDYSKRVMITFDGAGATVIDTSSSCE